MSVARLTTAGALDPAFNAGTGLRIIRSGR